MGSDRYITSRENTNNKDGHSGCLELDGVPQQMGIMYSVVMITLLFLVRYLEHLDISAVGARSRADVPGL